MFDPWRISFHRIKESPSNGSHTVFTVSAAWLFTVSAAWLSSDSVDLSRLVKFCDAPSRHAIHRISNISIWNPLQCLRRYLLIGHCGMTSEYVFASVCFLTGSQRWVTHAYTGSGRASGCTTTRPWWLHLKTAKSSSQCSCWTLSSTTRASMASTVGGSSLDLSRTWTPVSGNWTPGTGQTQSAMQRVFRLRACSWRCCAEPPQALCGEGEAGGCVPQAVQQLESNKGDLWVRHRALQFEPGRNCERIGQKTQCGSCLQSFAHSLQYRKVSLILNVLIALL